MAPASPPTTSDYTKPSDQHISNVENTRDQALNWFKEWGWSTDVGYRSMAGLNIGHCGHNSSRLLAAAKRDKRPIGYSIMDKPTGRWQDSEWITTARTTTDKTKPQPTPARTPNPAPQQPAPVAVTGLDYQALWLREVKAAASLKAELAHLTGLLNQHGISVCTRKAA